MSSSERSKATRRNYRQARILVVEDDPAQWGIMRQALAQVLPEVTLVRVSSRPETLAYLDACGGCPDDLPKLVLLDLYLPAREDGWALLHHLKNKNGPLHRIPVVVLSNSSDPADVRSAYEQGVTSFVVKPVGYDEWLNYCRTLRQYWWETVTLPGSGT